MNVRSNRFFRITLIVAGSVVAVVTLGLLLTRVTASPFVCGSCHEMAPALASWKASGHTQVRCPQCHEKSRPWYQFPQTLAARSVMLTRDARSHWSGRATAALNRSTETTPTIPDTTCLKCHDPSRKVTVRFGTLINHPEHTKRNKSCASCHLWTAHPAPGAERPMLLMERCFACHGRTAAAKAPGTCDVCHPASFNLRPASHKPASAWRTRHGKVALAKGQPCAICHDTAFCRGCHGLEMPHPAEWGKGKPPLHSTVAKLNRKTCTRCHADRPNLCTMCHHKGWDPNKGPWLTQHPSMVADKGAAFCMGCHDPVFCFTCHLRGRIAEPASAGT